MNNFQSIRNDLFQEVEEIQDRERRDIEMQEFAEELDRQNYMRCEIIALWQVCNTACSSYLVVIFSKLLTIDAAWAFIAVFVWYYNTNK